MTQKPNGKRKPLLLALGAAFVLAGAAYGAWYMTSGRYHESTDNAYVNGNLVQLSARTQGTVVAIKADDTSYVKAGDVIVQLDETDATLALEKASASLSGIVREIGQLYGNKSQASAAVALRRTELARAEEDLKRRVGLLKDQAVSAEEVSHARDAVSAARDALAVAEEALGATAALTGVTSAAEHPRIALAVAEFKNAYLALQRTRIKAPVSGYVARRSVQVGQPVAPGQALLTIVPLEALWVDVNFKESQLANVRVGQPVELSADIYGSKVKYEGKILGIGTGTGSAFALLPAQNATGNWIKVVQRVPVRVGLKPEQLREHPLRIGLSMEAEADTHDRSGAMLNSAPVMVGPLSTDVYAQELADADAEALRLVEANLPAHLAHQAKP